MSSIHIMRQVPEGMRSTIQFHRDDKQTWPRSSVMKGLNVTTNQLTSPIYQHARIQFCDEPCKPPEETSMPCGKWPCPSIFLSRALLRAPHNRVLPQRLVVRISIILLLMKLTKKSIVAPRSQVTDGTTSLHSAHSPSPDKSAFIKECLMRTPRCLYTT
ncbi:hypothetical protein J3A83DRAFT_1429868 [Scleroderma citrinum]